MTARGLVVVTGADGFAGRAVSAHFRDRGTPFRGVVRGLSGATVARPDMFPVGDLTSIAASALRNALLGAHTVVHLAGRAHVMHETAADPLRLFRTVNVDATERVARVAAAAGAAHFVFASSVKVNGDSTLPGSAFRESDPPDPRDDYAASKWEAECALADVARDTGMPVTILRLPLLYGPGVAGNFARLTDAVARGVPLPLASIDNRRSLLGVGNLISALEMLITGAAAPRRATATYLLADAEAVSTPDVVRAIAAALGAHARLVRLPPSILRLTCACVGRSQSIARLTDSLVVDASSFRAAFGWRPPRSLADELSDMVRARRAAAPL